MILLRRMAASLVSAAAMVLILSGFGTGAQQTALPAVLVTAAPAYDALAGLRGGERFPEGAQILLARAGRTTPLVEGFAATADASVSFDAASVLFAGRKNPGEPWAIWELTLANHAVRKVLGGSDDFIRPLYVPTGHFVYARRTAHGFALEAAWLDGTHISRLTYMSASALPEDVLADGRILFQAGFPLGESITDGATPEEFLVYPDGSGVESYRCDHATARWGGRQLASGDVIFTHGATLARFTSALATETPVAAAAGEYAGGAIEAGAGKWLVSARSRGEQFFSLKSMSPGSTSLRTVIAREHENLIDPVVVAERTSPNRHPSALHDWDYANLLALDARVSRDGAVSGTPASVRVEAMDERGKAVGMGTAPVESDGSFFVKTPADQPIRFVLLDASGNVIRRERGWFWIRRGEQRICTGCHAGPEHAAANRVPEVLMHTTTPVDLTGSSQVAVPGGH